MRFRQRHGRVKRRDFQYIPEEQVIFHYGRRPFIMSPPEHDLYRILLEIVGDGYYVFPQMQLSSIFDSHSHRQKFMDALRHINQKSVDYVICDRETTAPILIIELDGWSHQLAYRQRRDQEINRIAEEAGIAILHLQNYESIPHEALTAQISALLQRASDALPPVDSQS